MIGHDLLEKYHLRREAAETIIGSFASALAVCPRCLELPPGSTACPHGVAIGKSIDAPWADWRALTIGEVYDLLRANGWDVDGLDPETLVRRINLETLGKRSK